MRLHPHETRRRTTKFVRQPSVKLDRRKSCFVFLTGSVYPGDMRPACLNCYMFQEPKVLLQQNGNDTRRDSWPDVYVLFSTSYWSHRTFPILVLSLHYHSPMMVPLIARCIMIQADHTPQKKPLTHTTQRSGLPFSGSSILTTSFQRVIGAKDKLTVS